MTMHPENNSIVVLYTKYQHHYTIFLTFTTGAHYADYFVEKIPTCMTIQDGTCIWYKKSTCSNAVSYRIRISWQPNTEMRELTPASGFARGKTSYMADIYTSDLWRILLVKAYFSNQISRIFRAVGENEYCLINKQSIYINTVIHEITFKS